MSRVGGLNLRTAILPALQVTVLSLIAQRGVNNRTAFSTAASSTGSGPVPSGGDDADSSAGGGKAALQGLIKPFTDSIRSDRMLTYKKDRYNGVIIDAEHLPTAEDEFTLKLDYSLAYWKSHGRRGVWLKIPLHQAALVAHAAQRGFVFHHAEKEYVMMTNWLSEEENRLPPNASHQVGVGCVVLIDDDKGDKSGRFKGKKMLLVQEKNGPLRGTGVWKMPTGLADIGEDIAEAAVREVKEETGIDAEFVDILCFRQAHNILFGKSDLWFVCVLRPLSTVLQPQDAEIAAVEWHDPAKYLDQEFFKTSGLHQQIEHILVKYMNDEVVLGEGDQSEAFHPSAASSSSAAGGTRAAGAAGAAGATGTATASAVRKPSTIKVSKLPVGWRPGTHSLYYIHDRHHDNHSLGNAPFQLQQTRSEGTIVAESTAGEPSTNGVSDKTTGSRRK